MCGIFYARNAMTLGTLLRESFNKSRGRGPDQSYFQSAGKHTIGFHRLAINGLNTESNQPFCKCDFGVSLICNGEIYNFERLYNLLDKEPDTDSDCEVILDLYLKFGIDYTIKLLDGVFAFVIIDTIKDVVICGRDPFGVRPMFYLFQEISVLRRIMNHKTFYCASELKQLSELSIEDDIKVFPPGNYSILNGNELTFHRYFSLMSLSYTSDIYNDKERAYDFSTTIVRDTLIDAVKKRLLSDRPIACLLSGGLDSSLIASIVSKHYNKQLETFSIGFEGSPDLINARKVAEFLKTKHHEIIVTEKEFLDAIPDTIKRIESYDTTSVRASVGNSLVAKYISENSDAKVIFNGDGADELMGGYLYFHKCENELDFDYECRRLLNDIYYFDVLRSDRSISSWGLEPRTPFLDRSFVTIYMGLPLSVRFQKGEIEKKLIRDAFAGYLPIDILYRKKEAFSDGVSLETRSWFQIINEHVEKIFDKKNDTYYERMMNYPDLTKEQAYYKMLFDEYYPNKFSVIPYYWMPKWSDTKDPSARTL